MPQKSKRSQFKEVSQIYFTKAIITLLTVENNKMVQELTALIVSQDFGIETILVTGFGYAKLEIMSGSPDLIILDTNL